MCRVRETALYSQGEAFFIASTEAQGLSSPFLSDLTAKVAGSEEESDERP